MAETRTKTVIDEAAVVAAGVETYDLNTVGNNALVVEWTVTDATAVGDLGATSVKLYAPDGTTLLPTALTPVVVHAAVLVGSVAALVERYDITGLGKLQLSVENGAGSARDIRVDITIQG